MSKTAPSAKPWYMKIRQGNRIRNCSLTLEIDCINYHVERVHRIGDVYMQFQLRKVVPEGSGIKEILVSSGPEGMHCSCEDFAYRREGNGELCKHLRAALGFGVLLPDRMLADLARGRAAGAAPA